MELSIIIVNYKSVNYLRKCISSILEYTNQIKFEIIVVDNNSQDECEDYLKTVAGNMRFIQSKTNLGFAGANNLGFLFSKGKYLLFLNPDTELTHPSIDWMWNIVTEHDHVRFLGCKLLNSDRSVQTSAIQAFPTIMNQSLDAELLRRIAPGLRLWGSKALLKDSAAPVEVDAISGACMMIRRDVFKRIGGFSSDYFMYSEDLDLCFKARQSGCKVYFTSGTALIHHGGQSTSQALQNFNSMRFMRESMMIFFQKTRGPLYAALYKITTAGCALLRLTVLTGLRPVGCLSRDPGCLDAAFSKWRTIFRWAVNLEP